MATTIYGLKTFKADGTTVVLQPSSESAVFGQIFTLNDAGDGATRDFPIPTRPAFRRYYKDFPEYTGRGIRPIQLRPGLHSWELGVGDGTNSSTIGVPYIMWKCICTRRRRTLYTHIFLYRHSFICFC